jgi:hypothetical protein
MSPIDRGSKLTVVAALIVALVAVLTLMWNLGWIRTREPRPPETRIELTKNSGPVGSVVKVSGTGFLEDETVTLYVHVFEVGSTEADGSGEFSRVKIRIPKALAQIPLPQVPVTAKGLASERVAQASFEVTGSPNPPGGGSAGGGGGSAGGGGGSAGGGGGSAGGGGGSGDDDAVIESVPCTPDGGTEVDVQVNAGNRVRWINNGPEPLELDLSDPLTEPSDPLDPGESYELTLLEPGEYVYTCVFSTQKQGGKVLVEE